MSGNNRTARFVCYPNGDVEDVQPRGATPGGGATNQRPPGSRRSGTRNDSAINTTHVRILLLLALLGAFLAGFSLEPDRDDPAAPPPDRVESAPPDSHAAQRLRDALQTWVERQQPPPRRHPLADARTLLDQTRKLLANALLVLDRVRDGPQSRSAVERALTQAEESLALVEEILCRSVTDGAARSTPLLVDDLFRRLADMREQAATLNQRIGRTSPAVKVD